MVFLEFLFIILLKSFLRIFSNFLDLEFGGFIVAHCVSMIYCVFNNITFKIFLKEHIYENIKVALYSH